MNVRPCLLGFLVRGRGIFAYQENKNRVLRHRKKYGEEKTVRIVRKELRGKNSDERTDFYIIKKGARIARTARMATKIFLDEQGRYIYIYGLPC